MFGWIASHPYAYPVLEAVHIAGIALLLGNLVLFELRVFGLGSALPVPALARLVLPTALGGFALAAASGLTMFASQLDELLASRTFVIKMGLVFGAGLNAALFHARSGVGRLDGVARAQSLHGAIRMSSWISNSRRPCGCRPI